ncbi:MAG: hypothetical protein OHK0013_05470 [Sandaracinaceae bacterium]
MYQHCHEPWREVMQRLRAHHDVVGAPLEVRGVERVLHDEAHRQALGRRVGASDRQVLLGDVGGDELERQALVPREACDLEEKAPVTGGEVEHARRAVRAEEGAQDVEERCIRAERHVHLVEVRHESHALVLGEVRAIDQLHRGGRAPEPIEVRERRTPRATGARVDLAAHRIERVGPEARQAVLRGGDLGVIAGPLVLEDGGELAQGEVPVREHAIGRLATQRGEREAGRGGPRPAGDHAGSVADPAVEPRVEPSDRSVEPLAVRVAHMLFSPAFQRKIGLRAARVSSRRRRRV